MLVSGVQLSDSVIYIYIFFFQIFSHIDYYRILKVEFPVKHPDFQCFSPVNILFYHQSIFFSVKNALSYIIPFAALNAMIQKHEQ